MNTDVCVVAVTYNSSAVLPRFLESIPRGVRTIVVDNASDDASAAIAEAAGAEVLRLDRNMGYGAASNIGARASRAKYLVLANPDIRFLDGAIDAMVAAAEQYPNAVFNPRMYNGKRQVVSPLVSTSAAGGTLGRSRAGLGLRHPGPVGRVHFYPPGTF